jgi:hypothetical protein
VHASELAELAEELARLDRECASGDQHLARLEQEQARIGEQRAKISGERARLAEERVELVQRLTEERGAQERARCVGGVEQVYEAIGLLLHEDHHLTGYGVARPQRGHAWHLVEHPLLPRRDTGGVLYGRSVLQVSTQNERVATSSVSDHHQHLIRKLHHPSPRSSSTILAIIIPPTTVIIISTVLKRPMVRPAARPGRTCAVSRPDRNPSISMLTRGVREKMVDLAAA